MIKLEFTTGGQTVKAETDSFSDAAGLLKSLGAKEVSTHGQAIAEGRAKAQAARAAKKPARRRSSATKAYVPWTKEEIRAIIEARGQKPRGMFRIPQLAGRGREAIQQMAGFVRVPANYQKASVSVQNIVREILSETPVTNHLGD